MEKNKEFGNRPSETGERHRKRYDEIVVPVIEESLHIEKETIEKSKVKIRKEVVEEIVDMNIPLEEEHIHIERIPKNEYVDDIPSAIRQEGDSTVISVLKEVVEKRTILVEEVWVKKDIAQSEASVHENIRKENLNIEREAINPDNNSGNIE